MKKKHYFLLYLLMTLLFTSCNNSSDRLDEQMTNFREDLVSKGTTDQKKIFNGLTTETKIRFWENKVSQVLSQDLSKEQRFLTEQILKEIPKSQMSNYDGINLMNLAIKMAKITPQSEFISMFVSYGDYSRDFDAYKNNINNELIIKDLEFYLNEIKINKKRFFEEGGILHEGANSNTQTDALGRPLPDCNCSWTCGFFGTHHNNCKATETGCGFLGQFSCDGHTGP